MAIFVSVSAVVLFSVIWDSTEEVRQKIRFDRRKTDF